MQSAPAPTFSPATLAAADRAALASAPRRGPDLVARLQVSSRKVLQAVLERHDVPIELFGPVCVVVDKIEKIKAEKVFPIP